MDTLPTTCAAIALALHLTCLAAGCDASVDSSTESSSETPEAVAPQLESDVVAMVNDREITGAEVDKRLAHIEEIYRYTQRPFDTKTRDHKRQEVIQRLVDRELLRDHVANRDIEVDTTEIDEQVQRRIDTKFGSTSAFRRYLDAEDMTVGDFRERLRQEATLKALIAQDVDRSAIDEKQLRQHYERIANRRPADDRVQASTISVELPRSIDADQRRKLRDLASQEIESESHFETPEDLLARLDELGAKLNLPVETRSGDMRWLERNQLRPSVSRALFADETRIDRPSRLVDTASGFQSYWIHERRDAGVRGFDEVEDLLRDRAYRSQLEERRRDLIKELRDEASISLPDDTAEPPAESTDP